MKSSTYILFNNILNKTNLRMPLQLCRHNKISPITVHEETNQIGGNKETVSSNTWNCKIMFGCDLCSNPPWRKCIFHELVVAVWSFTMHKWHNFVSSVKHENDYVTIRVYGMLNVNKFVIFVVTWSNWRITNTRMNRSKYLPYRPLKLRLFIKSS